MAEVGAKPILLDISRKAVKFSKKGSYIKNVDAHFVVGSILYLPFKSSSLDLVWSAGVLEHFVFKEQQLILHESLRVLKTYGKMIAIVPNRKAWYYNFFRILSIKTKTWPLGYKEPFTTEDFEKFYPKPVTFHSCGIFAQFDTHVTIPLGQRYTRKLMKIFEWISKSNFTKVDKSYPGLLLAAVWVKS